MPYTDSCKFARWPHGLLRDRAVEAFIDCAKRLEASYEPGARSGEIALLYEGGANGFHDNAMVEACFADMVSDTLIALDLVLYDIDAKVHACFGDLPKAEHNLRCAQYIDWAFARQEEPNEYDWDMPAYLYIRSPHGSPAYELPHTAAASEKEAGGQEPGSGIMPNANWKEELSEFIRSHPDFN